MKIGTITLTKGAEYKVSEDRITISMSPEEVHEAELAFRELAVKAEGYSDQTKFREFKEFFDEAHRKWEQADIVRQRERNREKDEQRQEG